MPTLLTIPRELRDKIFTLIVSPYVPELQDISDPSNRATLDDYKYDKYFHGRNVLYIEHPKKIDTASLLLVNRQLHTETLDVIRVLPTKHSYFLDIIIAEEKNLWPTWLYVPVLTTRVDRVYAQIRSIGFPTHKRGLFNGGAGGPPSMTWALYNLIERFLKVGPVGRQAERGDKRFSINELIIDVRTPDVGPELISPERTPAMNSGPLSFGNSRRRGNSASETPLMRHPKVIAIYIAWDLKRIMEMDGDYGENGAIIYERIGSIKLLVDGEPFTDSAWEPEVKSEWDLADCLANMKYGAYWGNFRRSHPQDERRRAYNLWVEKAYKSRVELGLPVKPKVPE
ncbi:hypothetical protein N431DRAFT_434861 [Stipitochalara longipes BDJ]|nr:hypothetical protein N431DRAFT_434861 [Stipitochalara longipes BDJ]